MFNALMDIIGYSGSTINNIDSYVVYASLALVLLVAIVSLDNIYKFLRGCLERRKVK